MFTTLLMLLAMDGAPAVNPPSPSHDASGQPATVSKTDSPLQQPAEEAEPVDIEERFKLLSAETAAAKAEAKAAHAEADLARKEAGKDNQYRIGVGLGALFPMGEGSRQFGVNANLSWLTAQWVPVSGIGVGFAPTITFSRVRFRVIDLGVFYDYGTPLTVPDIKRSLDITFGTGLDVRIWKSLALHSQLGWFIPNPASLYDAAVDKFKASESMNGSGGLGTIGSAKNAWDYTVNRLGDALKSPMLTVGIGLQF